MLKLNQKKMGLIIIQPKTYKDIQLQVDEKTECVAELLKNLEVYFDSSLVMEKKVNSISYS